MFVFHGVEIIYLIYFICVSVTLSNWSYTISNVHDYDMNINYKIVIIVCYNVKEYALLSYCMIYYCIHNYNILLSYFKVLLFTND